MNIQKSRFPNLFLIGAMKSATTSLHNYLDMHPEIYMSKKHKEPDYFVKEMNLEKGIDWYLSLFSEATNEKYLGESSTSYTRSHEYEGVPERIYNLCPNSKIIYVMRDPIERSISHYWWEVQYGAEGRKMPIAILNSKRNMLTSYYAMQIKPYIKLFGIENIFTLTAEELIASPEDTMRNIYSWLKVDTDFKPTREFTIFNRSQNIVNHVPGSEYISSLKETKFWVFLKKIIPNSVRSSLVAYVIRKFSKPVEKKEDYRDETIKLLRPIMQKQVLELSELLNKDFPEWKTLHGN
jgi:hypothetical protein